MSERTVPYDVGPRPSGQAAIVAAAYLHPHDDVRESMRPDVESWIESLRPLHDERAVASVLDADHGTAIEPFVLSEGTRGAAIALVRAAFSKATKVSALRIVSEDTLGDEGGLLVRRDLSTTFLSRSGRERSGDVDSRSSRFDPWVVTSRSVGRGYLPDRGPAPEPREPYFVPPMLPASDRGERIFVPVGATVRLEKDGATVRAALGPLSGRGANFGPVRVVGETSALDRVGLSIRRLDDGFEVRTGNPESLIRFASLSARRTVLVVETEEGSRRGAVSIRLEPLVGSAVELRARAFVWSDLSPWLSLSLPPSPTLGRWAGATAAWVGPQPEWAEELLHQEEEHETVTCR